MTVILGFNASRADSASALVEHLRRNPTGIDNKP